MSRAGLLSDVRVLDLAGENAVLAARLLADLGADVIRIEPPSGDPVRRRPPFLDSDRGPDASLHHLHYNRNKRSVVLDLESQHGRAALLGLVAGAGAVIETAAPGAMDALGIGYEAMSAVNPGLIYTTVTPFGQIGPFRHYTGNDLTGAASAGLLYLNGFADSAPDVPGGEQAYKMASLVAAASTLMVLAGRRGEGGARIDVSIQEAASMATLQTANANLYEWHGRIPRRMGNLSGIQRCRDGKWVSFVMRVGSQANWADMADWLRDESIDTPVTSPEWGEESFRIENRRAVADAIARLCAKHDRAYIFHEGQRRKQLVMPVNAVADLLADEQLRQRGFFTSVPHPASGGTFVDSGLPYQFSAAPVLPHRGAPGLGEHTEEVLAEIGTNRRASPAGRPVGGSSDPLKPLAGIRVADFGWMIAGPATSRMLADFGAEVIKIESEYRLDNIRMVGVQPAGEGSVDTNGVFNDCNTNKLSVRLNVNSPEGLSLVKEIIKRSDLVLNNYTAERMPRWGLGYEDLKTIRPDIIMLSMPVMGTAGPYRNYGSYGNGVIAYGGLNMITGEASRPPVGLGPLYSDFAGPYLVVSALMAALQYRKRTGEGQFVDFSQVEATISLLGPSVLEYSANGRLPARAGNTSAEACPHGVYPCFGEDRWAAIAARDDSEWRALAEAMGRPELVTDERFASLEARKAHEGEVDALVSDWTRDRDPWQVMHRLQARGVPAAVVEDLEDMCVRDPWLSKQHLVAVPFEEGRISFRTHAQPLRINGEMPALRHAPAFGEHSQEVLQRLLGISDEEFERLLVEKVVY